MSLASVFTTAWKDVKAGLTKAEAFVTKEESTIQGVVTEGSAIVSAAVPSLAPVVTAFDQIEEALVGEIAAAINDGSAITASTGQTTVTLSAEISSVLKSIVSTITGASAIFAAASKTTKTATTSTPPAA